MNITQEAIIEECEQGHKFAKLADHPKRDGLSRCPHCMAIGLDAARAAIAAAEARGEERMRKKCMASAINRANTYQEECMMKEELAARRIWNDIRTIPVREE